MRVGQPLHRTGVIGEHLGAQLISPCSEFERPGDFPLSVIAVHKGNLAVQGCLMCAQVCHQRFNICIGQDAGCVANINQDGKRPGLLRCRSDLPKSLPVMAIERGSRFKEPTNR